MVAVVKRIVRRIRRVLRSAPSPRYYMVRSPQSMEGDYSGPDGQVLYGSSFNVNWLQELAIEPQLIVDVGSYDGGDAYRFHRAFPEARVIAIEADGSRAEIVRKSLRGTPIEVIECAATHTDGYVSFYPTKIDGQTSSQGSIFKILPEVAAGLQNFQQAEEPVVLAGRSLSSLIGERRLGEIDLLHMDIQGAEYDALVGLGDLRPKCIFAEMGYWYQHAPGVPEVHELLSRMGYRLAADLLSDRLYVMQ